ncbi:MAG TPA: choice-of-anchor tandem repeat GloVer-containing protein [Rhizomicrobium sp.]|nr:choice-of-anchor tandem repeat GloVer-containing protein [Rhizomicrobium sp.]
MTPEAGLLNVGGILYGTTESGGAHGGGTVFTVDPHSGVESVLYSFGIPIGDGFDVVASLIGGRDGIYGTTEGGGNGEGEGCGTVFSINPSTGQENVLYAFQAFPSSDGCNPVAGVIRLNGALYGTTLNGGTHSLGTVFSVDLNTGAETVLHSFGAHADGANPWASLVEFNGLLYGTTAGGPDGWGAVFAINPQTGAETVVHTFLGPDQDGGVPTAPLINVDGELYGTTEEGGARACDGARPGCGTVFRILPNGREKVLYSFCLDLVCADGGGPEGGLLSVDKALYGMTSFGGTTNFGAVFKITAQSLKGQ